MPEPDEPDWDRIVERHAERVFRIAWRILGTVHDAEDVAQEVFREAIVLHRQGPIRTWAGLLVRLATLRSLDRRRSRKHSVEMVDTDPVCYDKPEHQLIASELADWLRSEVPRLPDQQAAVFSLTYYEQLSRNEIAATLEISPASVSTTLYNARQRLSDRMGIFQGEKQ